MSDQDWSPPREWDPALNSTVIDRRGENRGARGTVVRCDRYGHFADPYWRASVDWGNWVEHDIETTWLEAAQ